jgi:chemotaxis regulatin CheY-phosphate phosphatase CheZ
MSGADDEIAVDIDDLRNDAALWCQAAALLEQAVGQGRGENPPNSAFMLNGMLVAEAYRDLARQLLDRMVDGVAQFQGLCRVLPQIANAYEAQEQKAVEAVNSLAGELEVVDA